MVHFLSRKPTREYILKRTQAERTGWTCTRVSEKVLDEIEARIMLMIGKAIKAHPTRGRTFTDI